MATAYEDYSGRQITDSDTGNDSVVTQWRSPDATDEFDAIAAVKAAAPLNFNGLRRQSVAVSEVLKEGDYELRVTYGQDDAEDDQLQEGDVRFRFDTTGRTFKRSQSIKTISETIPQNSTAKVIDFQQTLNVDSKGKASPLDVIEPSIKFTITKKQERSIITESYVNMLAELTGTTNDEVFYGFDPEELLFLGATGSERTTGASTVNYNFEARKTEQNIPVYKKDPDGPVQDGDIIVAEKKGWHYLWVHYRPRKIKDKDTTPKTVLTGDVPVQANVEQVYYTQDFTNLQI